MDLKRTPLYPMHQKYQGKLVDFGGWELSVEFPGGIISEHHKVRTEAGLFDVSHMGEIEVTGERAEALVQKIITNDAARLAEHQICYTLMCYPDGGIVDDLLVYKYSPQHYFLVVNAANTDKDFTWIKYHELEGSQVTNLSDQYAQLALQGPKSQAILQKICNVDLSAIKYYWFNPQAEVAGISCLVSRTGYTGEDGFEIYVKPDRAVEMWEAILAAGGDDVSPIGLGARDTLRFESKLPLYGQEIGPDISPLEAGLAYFVKFDKADFIGKDALLKQKLEKPARSLVEFEMVERGIPRSHYEVEKDGVNIGYVTTGSYAPTLKKNMGLAIIKREFNQPGQEIDIIIRNKPVKAVITKGSFYKRDKK